MDSSDNRVLCHRCAGSVGGVGSAIVTILAPGTFRSPLVLREDSVTA